MGSVSVMSSCFFGSSIAGRCNEDHLQCKGAVAPGNVYGIKLARYRESKWNADISNLQMNIFDSPDVVPNRL